MAKAHDDSRPHPWSAPGPKAEPLSLEEYAAQNPQNTGGKPCWACGIPEAEEINAAKRNGRTISTILGWLRDVKGYQEATKGKLEGHFVNNRHHERKG